MIALSPGTKERLRALFRPEDIPEAERLMEPPCETRDRGRPEGPAFDAAYPIGDREVGLEVNSVRKAPPLRGEWGWRASDTGR